MSLFVDIEKNLGSFTLKVKFETGNETLGLLGGSGSGKSMTLKCIAGIEKPDKGRIVVDGVTMFDSEKHINLPPQKRKVGYLFQQYALFPNMTVRQNIACGVRDKSKADTVIPEIIKAMQLEGLENRKPSMISGGQQQRVALARILVNEPEVLLLDEPFSALDSQLRFRMEMVTREVIHEFGKSVIVVTHDRDEAFRLSDHIAIINHGTIDCFGTKEEVFDNPVTMRAAVMTGCKNISPIEIRGEHKIYAKSWDIELEVAGDPSGYDYVGIRRHYLEIETDLTDPSRVSNSFLCTVTEVIENPFSFIIMLQKKGCPDTQTFSIEVNKDTWEKVKADELYIYIPKEVILLLKE